MLNKKQREFFYHALHLIKTSHKPFYAFLSGGGGVGKSHLIKSIYQHGRTGRGGTGGHRPPQSFHGQAIVSFGQNITP